MARLSSKSQTTSYRGSQVIFALLTFLLVFLLMFSLASDPLASALHALRRNASPIFSGNLVFLSMFLLIPLVSCTIVLVVTPLAVHALRVLLYAHRLHRYLDQYLRVYAPLWRLGVEPYGTTFSASGQAQIRGQDASSKALSDILKALPYVQLIGDSGTGKSLSLLIYAHHLTRRRSIASLIWGRSPLPLLLSLSNGDFSEQSGPSLLTRLLMEQIAVFGTSGLVSEMPNVLRRSHIAILCDGLDKIPVQMRHSFCKELASIAAQPGKQRVVTTCHLQSYLENPTSCRALHSFERVMIGGMPLRAVDSVMCSPKTGGVRGKGGASAFDEQLVGHALDAVISVPAYLDQVRRLRLAEQALPYGRNELSQIFVEAVSHEMATDTMPAERIRHVLADFAITLIETGADGIPLLHYTSPGVAIWMWLRDHGPSSQEDACADLDMSAAETLVQRAYAVGVFCLSASGLQVGFANSVIQASFAAHWLATNFEHAKSIDPNYMHARWHMPFALWSALPSAPANIASLVLELANDPLTAALYADLPSQADVYPTLLSVSLMTGIERMTNFAARSAADPAFQRGADIAEQQLRGTLDQMQRYISDQEHAERMVANLHIVERASGVSLLAGIDFLVCRSQISRLARGQLIMLLGLIGSRAALGSLMELMRDPDVVIRQAIGQALAIVGDKAEPMLRRGLKHVDVRVRVHSAEILTYLTPPSGPHDPDDDDTSYFQDDVPLRTSPLRTLSTTHALSTCNTDAPEQEHA
ncbi:MAG: hypothetical protein OJF49_000043 [Ktedonobacterales bacterium]|nr:MAG: hypothetical protein OJF49_000043 [Ktedonobacterales bacterium]